VGKSGVVMDPATYDFSTWVIPDYMLQSRRVAMSDEHKRLWFQAYCAALGGMLSSPAPFEGDTKLLKAAIGYADAALMDYQSKFGSDPPPDAAYEGWAHLEVMGRQEHYGLVREIRAYGTRLIEIQCLDDKGELTDERHQYGGHAIFCNTPMDEETCRHLAGGERKITCDHTDKATGQRCGVFVWSKRGWDYCPEHVGDRKDDSPDIPFDERRDDHDTHDDDLEDDDDGQPI